MLDYLKDYKIVPKSHTFDPVAVKFKLGKYQLVQVDNFLFVYQKDLILSSDLKMKAHIEQVTSMCLS